MYIYEPTDTYDSSTEGWVLEDASKLGEPVVDRHVETLASRSRVRRRSIGPSFFTMSGGILKRDPRTSNRIDSMLSRMLEEPAAADYSPHVDKNLDLLHTHLQLDMISIVAQSCESTDEELAEDDDMELI
jgi:hypothetical protein